MQTVSLVDLETEGSVIATLAQQVVDAKKVLVIVGAGISTSAGIPVMCLTATLACVTLTGMALLGLPVTRRVARA